MAHGYATILESGYKDYNVERIYDTIVTTMHEKYLGRKFTLQDKHACEVDGRIAAAGPGAPSAMRSTVLGQLVRWLALALSIVPARANIFSDILWSNWLPVVLFGAFAAYCVYGVLSRTPEQIAANERLIKHLQEDMNAPDEDEDAPPPGDKKAD
ncbi:unnamed protein product [Prorocentrum cordatum]|uniref:Dolichol-phosphate mannosyltransferase subunit 3 n=1 Tax=Prorocentrum cordatum TaxID=2364126 RepID=A0ABN9SX66_9DINO|nr:unnamed protein product [Polarella glacialis]